MPKLNPKSKPKRGQQSTLSCQEPKQKLKQDDRTAQREQQQLLEMKQKDAEIAQLKQELAETKQQKDDESAQLQQLQQQLAEAKLKQQEEQETKSRRCEEQMEKPVGEDQTGVPTIHSSEPVAGGREQPRNQSYKCALLGKYEKEFMHLPLKKPHESFEHSKKNLTPPAELPRLPVGEDATQPEGEDPTQPECEDQTGGSQFQWGSLGEKTEDPSWFEQSKRTNFDIVVEIPERTNNEFSERENQSINKGLGNSPDQTGLHRTNPLYAQIIPRIPHATPVEVKVQPENEFDLRESANREFVFREIAHREFVLREIAKSEREGAKPGKGALTLIDKNIVYELRTRFGDIEFKDHNGKYKLKHAIHKHPYWRTVRIICFLILTKPSQSDFDSMEYRKKHPFPDFENGSYEYDFYSKIRGGDGYKWLKVLEETAKKLGELQWLYFKHCELIAKVNHEAHPVIMPEKLLPYIKQHGYNCRGVDYGIFVEHVLTS